MANLYLKFALEQKAPKRTYIIGKQQVFGYSSKEVENVFCSIQEAWDEQNLEVVKDYYAPSLYQKHQARLRWLYGKDRVNHIKNIKIDGLSNFKALDDRRFELDISFSCNDYDVAVRNPNTVYGSKFATQYYKQRWRFTKDGKFLKVEHIEEIKLKTKRVRKNEQQ